MTEARYERLLKSPELAPLVRFGTWTVSGLPDERYRQSEDDTKVPLNFRALTRGVHFGARVGDEDATTDLDTLMGAFGGNPPNLAVYWNYDELPYPLLDIESHAEPELLELASHMPALYAESSLSGRGRHLVMPLPDGADVSELRGAHNMHAEEDGHLDGDWEIHMRHWVTFTGYAIDVTPTGAGSDAWDGMFMRAVEAHRSRASVVGTVTAADVDLDRMEREPPSHMREILSSFGRPRNRPKRSLGDFTYAKTKAAAGRNSSDVDYSAYEGHCMAHYAWILMRDMAEGLFVAGDGTVVRIGHDEWDDGELAYILYTAAANGLAGFSHRDKHDGVRCGMPYLLYEARRVVAQMHSWRGDEA